MSPPRPTLDSRARRGRCVLVSCRGTAPPTDSRQEYVVNSTDEAAQLRALVHRRLRRCAVLGDLGVTGALPVAHFGSIRTARAISVGINPSALEFDVQWGETAPARATRLGTLDSVGAGTRGELSDTQCDDAAARMDSYFSDPDVPTQWFCNLRSLLVGLGYDFVRGTAAHIDIVQEPTRQKWSEIKRDPRAQAQLALDIPFAAEVLRLIRPDWIVLDGATVVASMEASLAVERVHSEVEARAQPAALHWWTGTCRLPSGDVARVAGWNHPLVRVTQPRPRRFGERIASTQAGTT